MESPIIDKSCIITPYFPGLTMEHSNSFKDFNAIKHHLKDYSGDYESSIVLVENTLKKFDVIESIGDFSSGLKAFTEERDVSTALTTTLKIFTNDVIPDNFIERVLLLLHCLSSSESLNCRIYCHDPKKVTILESNSTHFGYVHSGYANLSVNDKTRTSSFELHPNTYFSVPYSSRIEGDAEIQIISRIGICGQLLIGGEIENWGRLKYIDGCSDTLLIPPMKLGFPCFNVLYFPESTKQTFHTHPSLRAGMVTQGEGICRTENGDIPLKKGDVFVLPPETWHAFQTKRNTTLNESALTVVAFHPDSDYGPTDEDHPMINRTFCKFHHRLKSLSKSF